MEDHVWCTCLASLAHLSPFSWYNNCACIPKYDKGPIALRNRFYIESTSPSQSHYPRLSTMCNPEEESGARGIGGGNKAIESSRRKNLAWMACANDRCNAIDTRWRNHGHNIQVEGPDPAQHLFHSVSLVVAKWSSCVSEVVPKDRH